MWVENFSEFLSTDYKNHIHDGKCVILLCTEKDSDYRTLLIYINIWHESDVMSSFFSH